MPAEIVSRRAETRAERADRRVVVLLLPHVHVLDLSGPVQVFYEANDHGGRYRLLYCGVTPKVRSAQGLWISDLEPLPEVGSGDLVLVPGIDSASIDRMEPVPSGWLREAHAAGATLCSICSGAFVLAHAGLLDGRRCTTHWKVADRLQERFPGAKVSRDRLFISDEGVITSAGVTAGIDTALWLVERDHGPMVVARVAREMVVYLRRHGSTGQESIYLDHRTHLHPGVHRAQDWIIAHPDERPTVAELAAIAGMSPRNMTRAFRRATGITVKAFVHKLKLEVAGSLLHNPALSVEGIASRCGFKDSRQLRRLWKRRYGQSPSLGRVQ